MTPEVVNWMTWVAAIVPLWVIAWSAYHYVHTRRFDEQEKRYIRFFLVMDHLGKDGGSIASKMAAAYEMRKFPEYADVIIRLCEQASVQGASAEMLKTEMKLTADYMRKLSK